MNVLEIAIYALVLVPPAGQFDCVLDHLKSETRCTNGVAVVADGPEVLRFSNGVSVTRERNGQLTFSNGLTTHFEITGWLHFSNGLSLRREPARQRFRFSNGYICRSLETDHATCGPPE